MPHVHKPSNAASPRALKTQDSETWVSRGHSNGILSYLTCKIIPSRSMEPGKKELYQAILEDRVHTLFTKRPSVCETSQFAQNQAMGICAHVLQFQDFSVKECGCPQFNRAQQQELRAKYEAKGIEQVWEIAQKQNHLDLTFCMSGFVLSELVFLIKLLKFLESKHWSGKLRLNFFDRKYKPTLKHESEFNQEIEQVKTQVKTLEKAVFFSIVTLLVIGVAGNTLIKNPNSKKWLNIGLGGTAAVGAGIAITKYHSTQARLHELEQMRVQEKHKESVTSIQMEHPEVGASISSLLTALRGFPTSGIEIKARFFGEADDYIAAAQKMEQPNDFLLGSDVDWCPEVEQVVNSIRAGAQALNGKGTGKGLLLISAHGNQPNFYQWNLSVPTEKISQA